MFFLMMMFHFESFAGMRDAYRTFCSPAIVLSEPKVRKVLPLSIHDSSAQNYTPHGLPGIYDGQYSLH